MSSAENLRDLIIEPLTVSPEEIFGLFERTVVQSEEEIDRQRRLLDITWKPEIKLHRIDLPPQHVSTEEEVLTGQQLYNQERNSSLDQEDPEPPQIKEEHEEPEHPQIKKEQEEPEPPQIKEEEEEPEPLQIKKEQEEPEPLQMKEEQGEPEPPQMKEEQQEPEPIQIKKEQEEPEPPQIKEEQEELCSIQWEEHLVLNQETDSFVETPTDEDSEHSEPEPNSNQFLSWKSESKQLNPKQSRHRNTSHSNNVDNSPMSESQYDTGKKSDSDYPDPYSISVGGGNAVVLEMKKFVFKTC
ncbi:pollen-specific leucine-rich repeat extensin-like protein 1 [Mugil cephalus]|uniref:pollen-specific leucine-rich repeat extensin-like protein 1 n=1 Tax=Mugil cephalus TaxID=48193 RepID=UPI001FB5CB49|nr:pollen-specific leucine-rich repeat extensin-like protein 1 [Mugil cephalus]